jgi:hypothetical protein
VGDERLAPGDRGDDCIDVELHQQIAQLIGVVGFIGNQPRDGPGGGQQVGSHHNIVHVARCDAQNPRPAKRIGQRVDRGRTAATRAPDGFDEGPPYGWPAPPAELVGGDSEARGASMDIAVLGIDLGKNSCSVVGLDGSGKVILRRRMQRKTIVGLASKLSPCIIAMEACCGAHHLGRVFRLRHTQFG